MILTAEQLKAITKGVAYWEDGTEGGLIPRRFCKAQEEVYRSHEAYFLRTRATSGVRLECRTNATALEISCRAFAGSAKDWYGFDLKVDGMLYGHFEGKLKESDRIHWTQALPQGEKTVTLYLPCLTGVEILEVNLKDAAVCQPVDHAEKILVMGDSITQGYSAHFPSMTNIAQMAAYRNADYLNQAIGGETFHPEILTPLDWKPTMAVIAYGSNDWALKDRQRLIEDGGAFLKRFHDLYPDLPTVVVTPVWRADALTRRKHFHELSPEQPTGAGRADDPTRPSDNFQLEEVDGILRELAAQYPNMRCVCGWKLLPQVRELLDDVAHPNELGFTVYAARLCAAMDDLNWR